MAVRGLRLSGNPEADALLSEDPLALLIGMVLDQQVPLEWAFRGPFELFNRLGERLDAAAIASMSPDELTAAFAAKPSLHRYPSSMARRVQDLCIVIESEYGNDPTRIWSEAKTGEDLLKRVRALPGFGDQKARIFVALLGKQMGVRPRGWKEASTPFGDAGSFRSVADIVDEKSLNEVRAFKKAMKAAHKSSK